MADPYDLEELAKTCLATATLIKQYLASNGMPQMSFAENGPPFFPQATPEIQLARTQLRIAAKTLYDLACGPDEIVTWSLMSAVCSPPRIVPGELQTNPSPCSG